MFKKNENSPEKTKYETSNINKIEEIGPQNFIDMYLDWLEELLNDLEDTVNQIESKAKEKLTDIEIEIEEIK